MKVTFQWDRRVDIDSAERFPQAQKQRSSRLSIDDGIPGTEVTNTMKTETCQASKASGRLRKSQSQEGCKSRNMNWKLFQLTKEYEWIEVSNSIQMQLPSES
jgi:hypothetical protein